MRSVHGIRRRATYQVKHSAGQDGIDGEADAALHAKKTRQRIIPEDGFLQPAHVLCGRITEHHVLLPHGIIRLVVEMQLRPVMHDNTKVVIAVHVRNVVGRDPRGRTILWVGNLQITRKLTSPRCVGIVELNKGRLDSPILRLLAEAPMEDCRLLDVPYDAQHVGKLTRELVLNFVLARHWAGNVKVHRVFLYTKVRTAYTS